MFGQVKKVSREEERLVIYIRPATEVDEHIRVGDYLTIKVVGRALVANGTDENGKEYWDLSNRLEMPGEKWQASS